MGLRMLKLRLSQAMGTASRPCLSMTLASSGIMWSSEFGAPDVGEALVDWVTSVGSSEHSPG